MLSNGCYSGAVTLLHSRILTIGYFPLAAIDNIAINRQAMLGCEDMSSKNNQIIF